MADDKTNELSTKDKHGLAKIDKPVKFVNEYLLDTLDGLEKSGLVDAVKEASPWIEAIFEAGKETFWFLKFTAKVLEKISEEKDPDKLGHIACTLAYERSFQQAISISQYDLKKQSSNIKEAAKRLKEGNVSGEIKFYDFSYKDALLHPFVQQSDSHLTLFAYAAGINATQLVLDVHSRFVFNLKLLLSHGDTKVKFEPFRLLVDNGTSDEKRAYDAILDHMEYQRWLFEDRPMLGVESFSLSDVYVETDCGELTWKQIRENKLSDKESIRDSEKWIEPKIDPFSEHIGGRFPLLESVTKLIADPHLNEPIVVQGVAGAGKSAFTLRLCRELYKYNLRPIRIQLRDLLSLGSDPFEAFSKALRYPDEDYWKHVDPDNDHSLSRTLIDPFMNGNLFNESISFEFNEVIDHRPSRWLEFVNRSKRISCYVGG